MAYLTTFLGAGICFVTEYYNRLIFSCRCKADIAQGKKEGWKDKAQIQHVEAFFDFIAAFTSDPRYQYVKEDLEKIKTKGEKVGMNDPYLDMLLENRAKRIFVEGEQTGIQTGLKTGRMEGENKMAKLMEYLLANGTQEEVQKALSDADARAAMYEKYGIEDTIKFGNMEEIISA